MAQYRVKPGFTFGWDDRHGAGAVVELTEAEARGFLDKLELVEAPAAPAQDEEPGDEPGEEPGEEPTESKKRKG
jgi:hypothetical protein